MGLKLTTAQRTALIELSDGRDHLTWKRATGQNGRVNYIAANSLRKMGLARMVFCRSNDQVRITDLGMALVNDRALLHA